MMMRKATIAIAVVMGYFVGSSIQAFADGNTSKRVVCSPEDYNDVDDSKCLFKFKLKKLQTKEFRGRCSYVDSAGATKIYKPKTQDCRKNNSANSCTSTFDASTADPTKNYM